jgi:predicted AAA+ superfamily ATPase
MNPRPYYKSIWQELSSEKPLVFVAGPRQSGKTTLSKIIAEDYINNLYFNCVESPGRC